MAHSYAPLAFVLSASLLMGCTIEVQSGGAESPPPPPPPPPGQTDQPTQPAQQQPADPATPAPKKTRLKSLRTALGGGGASDPQPDPAADQGTLKIQVVDGQCDIKIDGESQGTTNAVEKQIAVGAHEISCTSTGKEQKHSAEVKANETTTVAFSIQANTAATVPKQ